jgi:hypothetical protein
MGRASPSSTEHCTMCLAVKYVQKMENNIRYKNTNTQILRCPIMTEFEKNPLVKYVKDGKDRSIVSLL